MTNTLIRNGTVVTATETKSADVLIEGARINPDKCIGCDLCYIACWDGAHQCIHIDGHARPESTEAASHARIAVTPIAKLDALQAAAGRRTPPERIPKVDEHECVGCNLCWLVCPVESCITMEQVDTGRPRESWEMRTHA